MCVIAYKAKDVRFPSERNVRDMWDSNPDGAGVMWRDPKTNSIKFSKGFMKRKHLEKWINDNRSWLEKVECALHFRITTHGGTSAGNCHPFVVDDKVDSHLLSGSAPRVLMHNGVLPIEPRSNDISDSAELALRIGKLDNPCAAMDSVNECLKGNRIILMDESGTHFFGDKFKKSDESGNDGILYSNLNHEFRSYYRGNDYGGWNSLATHYLDDRTGKWKETETGKIVPFSEVDPYGLDDMDLEMYEEEYVNGDAETRLLASRMGLSVEDYRTVCDEAAEIGMDAEDYYNWYYLGDEEIPERVAVTA